jgi:recombination protein RecR
VIMALRATVEGDTTTFYLAKRLAAHPVSLSTIARGISVGGDLDQADELTLGRSIADRKPYVRTSER